MNFKQFISSVSALAVASSVFAGLAVTASAETEELDFIGSSAAAETYDGYNISGWSKPDEYHDLYVESNYESKYSATSDYLTGSVLVNNGKYQKNSEWSYDVDTVTNGKVYFNSGIGSAKGGTSEYNGGKIILYDKSGSDVLSITIPNGTDYIAFATNADSENSGHSHVNFNARGTGASFSVDITLDLDANTANINLKYPAANGSGEKSESIQLKIADASTIAGLKTITINNSNRAQRHTLLDNTKFYAVCESAPKDPVNSIKVVYNDAEGSELKTDVLQATDLFTTVGSGKDSQKATSAFTGDKLYIPFQKYIFKDGVLYEVAANSASPSYGDKVEMELDTVLTKTANKVEIPDGMTVVNYVEGSDNINDGTPQKASGMATTRGSLSLGTVEPGTYEVEVYVQRRSNATAIYLDGEKLAKVGISVGTGSYEIVKTPITVTQSGALTVGPDEGGSDQIDYVIIKRTGDYVPTEPTTISKGFTFDADLDSLGEKTLKVTIDGETKSLPMSEIIGTATSGDGDILLGLVITNIADTAKSVSAVIE